MLSNSTLKYHYHPAKGWINDPNGLCYFDGYYHIFYQHLPNSEYPWKDPMVWGHARTKDFLNFEELPVAMEADQPYDKLGVWSGTAMEKNGRLFAYYASVDENEKQTISMAYSDDGIHFHKYEGNPIISAYPFDCGGDFRDPAIFCEGDECYLVIASSDRKRNKGVLALYSSKDMFHWTYKSILQEYDDCIYCECPSFLKYEGKYMLSASVRPNDGSHYFEVMLGTFDGEKYVPEIRSHFQKGPDEYAGQIFSAPDGRAILISWVPGWSYRPEKCIGCMSIPLEITQKGNDLNAYPVKEVRHLINDNVIVDDYIKETYIDDGREVQIELLQKP